MCWVCSRHGIMYNHLERLKNINIKGLRMENLVLDSGTIGTMLGKIVKVDAHYRVAIITKVVKVEGGLDYHLFAVDGETYVASHSNITVSTVEDYIDNILLYIDLKSMYKGGLQVQPPKGQVRIIFKLDDRLSDDTCVRLVTSLWRRYLYNPIFYRRTAGKVVVTKC